MSSESDSDYYVQAREMALGMALGRTRGSLRAEDIAQTAVARLMALPEKPDNLQAWLRRIVNNLTIDKWRADRRQPPIGDEIDEKQVFINSRNTSPSLQALRSEYFEQVWAELGEVLSRKELDVLQLTVAGQSQTEIAEELGYASADSVKTTLSRIRKKVRELGDGQVADWLEHPRVY